MPGDKRAEQQAAELAAEVTVRADELAAEVTAKADELAAETSAKADALSEETAARAVSLALALSKTLAEIARRLDRYSAFGKRSRKIIIALMVSFVLDITLTIVLGFTAFTAHSTANTSAPLVQALHTQQAALHAAQLQACAGGNTFRSDQNIIWRDFIRILITPTAASTKAEIEAADKLAAQFLRYVTTVNRPVNCTALYGK